MNRTLLALAVGAGLLALPGTALAEDETYEPATLQDLGSLQRFTRIGLGLRSQWVSNAGYDPFSKSDYLAAWTVEGSRTILVIDRLSLSVGGSVDLGASSAEARGAKTSLGAHRFTVPVEGRYHLAPWLMVFGKLAPGAMVMTASIKDPSGGDQALTDTGAVFAADGSLGAAFLFGTRENPDKHPPRFWATGEWGYGWTTSRPWTFRPEDDEQLTGKVGSTNLGPVAFRGTFFRLGAALSF